MIPKVRRVPVGLFPKNPPLIRKGRFVTVKVAPNAAGFRRYGAVVPKAVAARATERNRLKRLIYRVLKGISSQGPEDVIVVLKSSPSVPERTAFEAEIRNLTA